MKTVRMTSKSTTKELELELLEFVIYYKLSYPTGAHKDCSILMDDKTAYIHTPDALYTLDNDLYVDLHIKSNKVIAAMYKYINEYEKPY